MATTSQLNAGVDALRAFAFEIIKQKVPGFMQAQADAYVTNDELLAAVKVVASAIEGN
jgi:hypothetical protein